MKSEKEETVFAKDDFIVKLVRLNGQMVKIKIEGNAELTETEAINLQWALNKFTGHI